jgi:hypothetical protein
MIAQRACSATALVLASGVFDHPNAETSRGLQIDVVHADAVPSNDLKFPAGLHQHLSGGELRTSNASASEIRGSRSLSSGLGAMQTSALASEDQSPAQR